MMTLMKETEVHKKKNKASVFIMILCLTGVMVTIILALSLGIGFSAFWTFLDMATLVMLVVPVLLVLAAAGLLKSFFLAFRMLGRSGMYTEIQWKKAKLALRLGANSFLTIGGLETVATVILLLVSCRQGMTMEQFFANTAVASLGVLYGTVAYLLLLPVRYRLTAEMEENM